jgi:hypothetical protein
MPEPHTHGIHGSSSGPRVSGLDRLERNPMPKITYVPLDRLDPMYSEAPTRYSPREKAKVTPNKNNDARQAKNLDREIEETDSAALSLRSLR